MDRCPDCGGSGVLRTDAAGYRTCLTCVGQGTLPRFALTGFNPALLAAAEAGQVPSVPDRLAVKRRRRLSASSSGG